MFVCQIKDKKVFVSIFLPNSFYGNSTYEDIYVRNADLFYSSGFQSFAMCQKHVISTKM